MKRILLLAVIIAVSACNQAETEYKPPVVPPLPVTPATGFTDKAVAPVSVTASSNNTHSGRLIDGRYGEMWEAAGADGLPVTLDFSFRNAEAIDYLVYYPRMVGPSGNFDRIEIWAAADGAAEYAKVKEMTLGGTNTVATVPFGQRLRNVSSIRVKILSVGGKGGASCAEMEFYASSTPAFDVLALFTDATCSALKAGVTQAAINEMPDGILKTVAAKLLTNTYDADFRIAQFKAFEYPGIAADRNKTNPYSQLDNPTGIAVTEVGTDFYVCVGDTHGIPVSIKVQDLAVNYSTGSSSYTLKEGVNVIRPTNTGLVYLFYHTADWQTAPPVKIHFPSGTVNGYFDVEKHLTHAKYVELLGKATDKYFDVLSPDTHITFPTQKYRDNISKHNILELMALYDKIFYEEQKFQGLVKYDKTFNNRVYMHTVTSGNMAASNHHITTNESNCATHLSTSAMTTTAWGTAHEAGHLNQTRPGLKWHGMTEITNNIQSLYITVDVLGNESRMWNDTGIGGYGSNWYAKAATVIGGNKATKGHNSNDYFGNESTGNCRLMKLIPFWQLYLYMVKVRGAEDFYKDLYEAVRLADDPATDGECQMEFIKHACRTAQLNLLPFFEEWAMLTPINEMVEDSSNKRFTVTSAQISDVRSWVAAQGYPTPTDCPWLITDKCVDFFKNRTPVTKGTMTRSGNTFTMTGWGGVCMFRVVLDGKTVFTSPLTTFTLENGLRSTDNTLSYDSNMKVYGVDYAGNMTEATL